MTLACEGANSKLVEVVTVADVDNDDRVGNSLLQIWKLRFGHKAYFCSNFQHKVWPLKFRIKSESEKKPLSLIKGCFFLTGPTLNLLSVGR